MLNTSSIYLSINCGTLTSDAAGVEAVFGKMISTKFVNTVFSLGVKNLGTQVSVFVVQL